jgi:ribosomal protein S24E
MKYPKDFGYMSIIETITDVDNTFLSRREITCNFSGLGGKLKKLDAVDMITKEFKLNDKVVIPMGLKNHVGKPLITGTFYVYDDEGLAKKQINPTIFSRLEKTKAKLAEAETVTEEAPAKDAEVKDKEEAPAKDAEVKDKEEAPAKDAEVKDKEEAPAKDAEVKADKPTKESKEEEKSK